MWIFGGLVEGPIEDITPTCLTHTIVATLREADSLANSVLFKHGSHYFIHKPVFIMRIFIDLLSCISQMPIVLVPIHFDRVVESKIQPSCQRSIVIRTFITSDFMTGVAAVPGQDIPIKVCPLLSLYIKLVKLVFRHYLKWLMLYKQFQEFLV